MRTKILAILVAFCLNLFAQEKKEFKFENGTIAYLVKGNDGWGVEDSSGKTIVPKVYGKLSCYGNMIYCVEKKDGKKNSCELYNSLGELKISEKDGYSRHDLKFVKSKGKWIASCSIGVGRPASVFDENGNMIYKYKSLKDAAGFWYLINELTDTIVIPPGKYIDYINPFHIQRDYILAKRGDKVGVVNFDGTTVIPAIQYRDIEGDWENYSTVGFEVNLNSKVAEGIYGYHDREGKCIIPAEKYSSIYSLGGGQFKVKEKGQKIIIDSLGNTISKIELKPRSNVKRREQEKNGFKYVELLDYLSDGSCIFGIEDSDGKTIIPCEYERIMYDEDIPGFTLSKDGYMGLANNDGSIIIPCNRYHGIKNHNRKYLETEYRGRSGLCDKAGNEIIPPIYDKIKVERKYGHTDIIVNVGIMQGVIDFEGNVIVPFEYTEVERETFVPCVNFQVKLFDKKGICDNNGKIIVPAKYTDVDNRSTYYRVKDGKTEGLYSMDGEMLFPTSLFKKAMILKRDDGSRFIFAYNDSKDDGCSYDLKGNLISDYRKDKLFDKYFEKGREEFRRENYKKAIDYYNQALSVEKNDAAYYNIGAAYYNLGKYKDAIEYLRLCKEISESQSIIDGATDLIIQCKLSLQKKRERRANFWSGFLGSAFNVASTIMMSNNAIRNHNSNASTGGFQRDTSLDYLLDPRYAAMQVQQQNWNEYLQMTNGGQTMTYEEWMAIKAQAWAESQKASGSNNSSTSSSSSSSSSYSQSSSGKDCRICLGTGKCNTCNGKGWFTALGIGTGDHPCPNCQSNHNGRCSSCGGTGKQ